MSDFQHAVCPHCGGVNRLPSGRDPGAANCGSCKRPLFDGTPHEVDEAGLRKYLARNDSPILVDFWAAWCGPCKMMAPAFAQAAQVLEPGARLLKLDTERAQTISAELGIRSIPTMILFKGGREIDRVSGAMDANGIVTWAQRAI